MHFAFLKRNLRSAVHLQSSGSFSEFHLCLRFVIDAWSLSKEDNYISDHLMYRIDVKMLDMIDLMLENMIKLETQMEECKH